MLNTEKNTLDDCPLLAIDFDDVLFDCDSALKEILKREFGFNDTYSEFIKTNSHLQEDVFRFLYGDNHQNCAVVSGAREAMSHLVTAYRVIVITGRSETTRVQTEKWLKSNFATIFSEVYFTNNFLGEPNMEKKAKAEICVNLGVDILIDDSWEEAISVVSVGITTLLFDKPWNRRELFSGIYRVRDWDHILTELL